MSEIPTPEITKYIQEKKDATTPLIKLFVLINKIREKSGQLKIINKELVPEGPWLLISNHFGGRGMDLFALDEKIRIVAGKTANWDRTSIHRALMRGINAAEITESLANTAGEERKQLMDRVPPYDLKMYKQVSATEEKIDFSDLKKIIKQIDVIVSILASGGKIAMFPEGLKQFEDKLHKAYRGFVVIAERYKKLTKKELTIIPVGMSKDSQTVVSVGSPFSLTENNTQENDVDWSMYHIARLLPKAQRGEYKNIPESLKP